MSKELMKTRESNLRKIAKKVDKWHNGQWRKGVVCIPYVAHCYDVTRHFSKYRDICLNEGGEELYYDGLAACFGHDLIEDCSFIEERELLDLFSERAFRFINAMTRPKKYDKNFKLKYEYLFFH